MGIPTLTIEEDRRQISSSLNIRDGELQQAFRKQHARRRLEEEKPSQQECQEDVLHEDCQDACEDAEAKEVHHLGEHEEEKPSQQECKEDVLHEDCQDACEDAEVKEVHYLGELEEEGQGGGDRQEHQEEPR